MVHSHDQRLAHEGGGGGAGRHCAISLSSYRHHLNRHSRHPSPVSWASAPRKRPSPGSTVHLAPVERLKGPLLGSGCEGVLMPRRGVVGREAAWELSPALVLLNKSNSSQPKNTNNRSSAACDDEDDGVVMMGRKQGPGRDNRGDMACECGRGSPTHGLPWNGRCGVRWCAECPYRPSIAVDMTLGDGEGEEGGPTRVTPGDETPEPTTNVDRRERRAALLVDAPGGAVDAGGPPVRLRAVCSRPSISNSKSVLVVRSRSSSSVVTIKRRRDETTTKTMTAPTTTAAAAAASGRVTGWRSCVGKRSKRSRISKPMMTMTKVSTADASKNKPPPRRRPPQLSPNAVPRCGDDGGGLTSDDIPAQVQAALVQLKQQPIRTNKSKKCECSEKVASFGIPGGRPLWCFSCPTKPDAAVNLRVRKCECGKHTPSFGLPGGKASNALWCSKCPTRPERAVDVKSKRCVCGKAQASLGIVGLGSSSATWCKSCPTKPLHAVNVKARRCECGKVQAYLGLPGESASSSRWCISCPTKPEGTVNLKISKHRRKR